MKHKGNKEDNIIKKINEKVCLKDREGKIRKGRKITVTSFYECPSEIIWEKIIDIDTLTEICKPKAYFKSISSSLPATWQKNKTYKFKLWIYGLVPLGMHEILLKKIDKKAKRIESQEQNKIIRIWSHTILIKEVEAGKTLYTDIVEIYAGIFTYPASLWSLAFYKHRQKKWLTIIQKSMTDLMIPVFICQTLFV